MKKEREQWQSRVGFLLATMGSAIGLGNIWRFAYMAYENGGGAFLVPYVIALVTAGIPLMILELGIGHKKVASAPLAYAKIIKRWEWLGWWAVTFIMFGIALYYSVIISWCLNYLFFSVNKSWGTSVEEFFFKSFLGITSGPWDIGGIRSTILIGLAFIWFVSWFIVYRGIGKGIEFANKVFMPLLFILILVLVVWSITLEGAKDGIIAYLKPNFSVLKHPRVWIDAYSQVFFSLSLGFGILIAYASYLPEENNITGNAVLISVADSLFAILAGFAVFSILGYMAFQTGGSIESVISEGIGLAFVAYPQAINLLPAFGNVFGVIFFLALVLAGLTSLVSIIEAFVAAVIDKFDFKRGRVVTVVSLLGFMGAIIFTTGGGLFWLDIVDHFLSHYGLVVVGILECILVGWLFHIELIRDHVNRISEFKVGLWWNLMIKFFIPFVLTTMLLWDLTNEFKRPYGGYGWDAIFAIGVCWLLVTLIIAFVFTWFPWRKDVFYRNTIRNN